MKNCANPFAYFLKPLLLISLLALLTACPSRQGKPVEQGSGSPSAAAAVKWQYPRQLPAASNDASSEAIRYGQQLVGQTPQWLGPEATDPQLRLAGNRLACSNCHLANGTQANAMGFVGLAQRFPAYYAPLDRKVTLAERVAACFERSLNAHKPLPEKETQAFVAYISWLSSEIPAGQVPEGAGLPEMVASELPDKAADLVAGKAIYSHSCAACHGQQGEGLRKDPNKPELGYTFPPVWGPDSYSNGSNMARLMVAARYIKANMPLGRAVLTTQEAFDVAAYINQQHHPAYAQAGKDYPNPATRPLDVPYGPYPDQIPLKQHQLGPYKALFAGAEPAAAP